MLRTVGSALIVGTLTVSVLAVTPFGSAIAQTPPPTCAQQMQACKNQVMDTRNACLPSCASNPNSQACDMALQGQFVQGINLCNSRLAECIADQPPSGSYQSTCTDISVSSEGTLSAS